MFSLREREAGAFNLLVVQINYEARVIYVRKLMTHAEYSYKNGAQWESSCGR